MAENKKNKRNNRNNGDNDYNPKFRKMRKKVCPLCADKDLGLDFKNADQMKKFVNDKGKILPRRATGACAKHQRDITLAVKRARQIATGSSPMTDEEDTSPVTLAADEIEEGKITLYDEAEWKEKDKQENNEKQENE